MRLYYSFWQRGSQVVFSALYNVRVFGRENIPIDGGMLLLSNHQSFLDPMLCGLSLPREMDYMARDSLFHNRWFGRYIRSVNAFPVHRGKADTRAIKEIIRRLKAGRAVMMFPEATRTEDGRIRTIKSGFELIARRSGATTVPVVIDGAFEVWPRHQILPGMGRINVQIGQAITPEEAKELGRDKFVAEVNRRLRTMQNELRQRFGKEPFDYEG